MSLLRIEQVCKRYDAQGGSRVALDGVSLTLQRGQMLGIYGPSGAGKSTLLRIAAGLIAPDSGQVLYDGHPLAGLPASERRRLRRREISCVGGGAPAQERLTVLDHVAVALLVDGRERRRATHAARQALAACEVESCARMELRELSGGQRQLVELARAIVTEPRLLLADAPASGLSMLEQEIVTSLLASLARQTGVGVLMAESEAVALIGADPILYMRDGRLIDTEPRQAGTVHRLPRRRAGAGA